MGVGKVGGHIEHAFDRGRGSSAEGLKSDHKAGAEPKRRATIDERLAWLRLESGQLVPSVKPLETEEARVKRRKQADDIDRMFILKSLVDAENESARNAESEKPAEGPSS